MVGGLKQADEDALLEIARRLPGEAAEALLELASGGQPQRPAAIDAVDPFEHPDAQRRFRIVADAQALALALEYPWEQWAVFLHPAQRAIVEKNFSGPAAVSARRMARRCGRLAATHLGRLPRCAAPG